MEGSNAGPDRGHVYYNGRPLCDDAGSGGVGWDIDDAHVICKMLGFSRATNAYNDACPFGACPPGIPFVKGGFKCTGSETNILDCPHDDPVSSDCGNNGVTDSSGTDIVGVKCE